MDFEEQQPQSIPPEPGRSSEIENFSDSDNQTNWTQLAASSSQAPQSSGRKRKRVYRKFSPSKNKRKRTESPRKRKSGNTSTKKKAVRGKAAVDPARKRLAGKLGT